MPRGLAAARSRPSGVAAHRAHPAERPGGADHDVVATPAQLVDDRCAEPVLDHELPRVGLAWVERAREVRGVEGGASIASCRFSPPTGGASRNTSCHWSCWSPPGVPNASTGRPSRSARLGESVVRGRRPGRSEFGSPSSNQDICSRVPSGKPSSGSPATTAASRRSAWRPRGCRTGRRRRCGRCRLPVSPVRDTVGSPTRRVVPASRRRGPRRRASAGGQPRRAAVRSCPGRSSPSASVADQRAPLRRVVRRQQRVERDVVGVAVPGLAVGEGELGALDDGVHEVGRDPGAGRTRRAGRAAAAAPVPGPTARSCRSSRRGSPASPAARRSAASAARSSAGEHAGVALARGVPERQPGEGVDRRRRRTRAPGGAGARRSARRGPDVAASASVTRRAAWRASRGLRSRSPGRGDRGRSSRRGRPVVAEQLGDRAIVPVICGSTGMP